MSTNEFFKSIVESANYYSGIENSPEPIDEFIKIENINADLYIMTGD